MKSIGLFGGTFDPIHNGHLHIAAAFADQTGTDTVVFLPAGEPYHKSSTAVSAAHRLAMTELAAAADSRFAVSDCDIVREGATYTIDTVSIFRQQFPQAKIYWLMGIDSLLNIHKWKNRQALVRQITIVAAARPGSLLKNAPAELHGWIGSALADGSLLLLDAPENPVSSTDIRNRLHNGQSVRGMIPDAVEAYIFQHGLYKPKQGFS